MLEPAAGVEGADEVVEGSGEEVDEGASSALVHYVVWPIIGGGLIVIVLVLLFFFVCQNIIWSKWSSY